LRCLVLYELLLFRLLGVPDAVRMQLCIGDSSRAWHDQAQRQRLAAFTGNS
jgi:hypothetical protein